MDDQVVVVRGTNKGHKGKVIQFHLLCTLHFNLLFGKLMLLISPKSSEQIFIKKGTEDLLTEKLTNL